MLIYYSVWLSPPPLPAVSLDLILSSCPDSFCTIIYILCFKHMGFLFLSPYGLVLGPSVSAALSGLRGLAQAQGWLLYKRVSGGRGAAGEGGENTESQATGKNGLIRAAEHPRPQGNTAARCCIAVLFSATSLSHTRFLSNSLVSFSSIHFPEIVVEGRI